MILKILYIYPAGRIFMFTYFWFLGVNFVQMVTGYDLIRILVFLYLIIVLLNLIPFDTITSKTENLWYYGIVLGLIISTSCFLYEQIVNFKRKSVINELYNTLDVLNRFTSLLEYKHNSNNVDYNSILNNLVGFIVFAGVCFFLYYLFSGGDGGRDPKDPTSSSSNTVSRSNSTDSLPSTSSNSDTESVNVLTFDEKVSSIIGEESIVKQWISYEKLNPLDQNQIKGDVQFFSEEAEKVMNILNSSNALDETEMQLGMLERLMSLNTSLIDFQMVVFKLTLKIKNLGRYKDPAYFEELETIADSLVNLLETQSNSGILVDGNNSPLFCSVLSFYVFLYDSQNIFTLFEETLKKMREVYDNHLERLSIKYNESNPYIEFSVYSIGVINEFLNELKRLADLQLFLSFKTINLSSILKLLNFKL